MYLLHYCLFLFCFPITLKPEPVRTTFISTLVTFSLLFTACTKQEIIPPEPDTQEVATARAAIENTSVSLLSGNWQITLYRKSNIEKTEYLKGYDFTFLPRGRLIAAQNGQNLVGTWVVAYIDDQVRLSFDFSSPALFIEMSGDWTITEQTDKKIKTQNVIGATDVLAFAKQ